jgi:hypothetical protein
MEVYAAMVDSMDQGIGRFLSALEEEEVQRILSSFFSRITEGALRIQGIEMKPGQNFDWISTVILSEPSILLTLLVLDGAGHRMLLFDVTRFGIMRGALPLP